MVMFSFLANSIAKSVGADTEEINGIFLSAIFFSIDDNILALVIIAQSSAGICLIRHSPSILSIVLCLPISSANNMIFPLNRG